MSQRWLPWSPVWARRWPPQTLLNVSYDPTRELYADVNAAFVKQWQAKTGQTVQIRQSHGGSGGRRARSSTASRPTSSRSRSPTTSTPSQQSRPDHDAGWQKRLPQNSSPYTSTIVFLVRKGNPKGIKDWGDLVKPGIGGDHAEPEDLGRRALELPRGLGVREAAAGRQRRQGAASSSPQLFKNVPVLDSGARGATTTFVQRGIGDVLLAWENEAYLALAEGEGARSRSSSPSVSILAEPPVAVVDKVVDKKGTRAVAEAYLQFLYTPEGQEIAAKHHYRPRDREGRREVRRHASPR